jgi:hypothetical protein
MTVAPRLTASLLAAGSAVTFSSFVHSTARMLPHAPPFIDRDCEFEPNVIDTRGELARALRSGCSI